MRLDIRVAIYEWSRRSVWEGNEVTVTVEMAKVYKARGRRFFSKAAAYRNAAWEMIEEKYPCDCEPAEPEVGAPGVPCKTHDGDKFKLIAIRLGKRLQKNAKKGVPRV